MTTTTTPNNDTRDSTRSNSTRSTARPAWLPADQWPFTIRTYQHLRADGEPLQIHYTDEGSGPTLVFVHAGMWSFIWRDVIAELRADFRCITLDFPGAGLSNGTRHDVDLATYPAVLARLLDHREVDKAVFVVHDLGGMVGVLAAADRPHRITGLVAANSFSWKADVLPLKMMLRIMGSHIATALLGTFRVLPRMTQTSFGVGRNLDRSGRQAFFGPYRSRPNSRNFHRALRSASRSGAAFEQAEHALASTLNHVDVLTVFGEKNDPFGFADRWRSLFPTAQSWVVEGGNHFPMCDDPDGFAKTLRNWHDAISRTE